MRYNHTPVGTREGDYCHAQHTNGYLGEGVIFESRRATRHSISKSTVLHDPRDFALLTPGKSLALGGDGVL